MTQRFREFFSESSYHVIHYNVYQPIVQKVAPFFKKQGITPNEISTLRICLMFIVTGILYYIYITGRGYTTRNVVLVSITSVLLLFCGISDDLDGYMARKYDMKTTIGKYLDNVADILAAFLIIWISWVYLGHAHIIIPVALVILFYQLKEKSYFKQDKYISPLLNVLTHTSVVYIIATVFIVLYPV